MDLKSTIVNKILNMNKRKLGVIVIVVFVSILIYSHLLIQTSFMLIELKIG